MDYLTCILKGTFAILMHNPAGMQATKRDKGLTTKTIPEPGEEAAASRYLLPDGNFYIPAVAVRNSLLQGAVGYRIGRRAARPLLAASLTIVDEIFELLDADAEPIPGDRYTIDSRRAIVQGQGIIRSRAKIDLPWKVRGRFGYRKDLATLDHIKTALTSAGLTVGLLDYRPEKNGWFGTFEVEDLFL
jgi:hypothetical protein